VTYSKWIMFSTPNTIYERVYKCNGSLVYSNNSIIFTKYQIQINNNTISLYTLYSKNNNVYNWITGFFICKDGTEHFIDNLGVYKSKQVGNYAYDYLGICLLSDSVLNKVFEETGESDS
jgi:hypothetical protein